MAPGPARILPSHARANPSRARPLGVFCTNDFHPRTREPRPAAANRISARTNSILARPNPSAGPQPAEMHERTPPRHARTQATRAAPVYRPNEFRECTSEPKPPAAAALIRHPGPLGRTSPAPPHERASRAHARTRATVRTPLPALPSPLRPPSAAATPAAPHCPSALAALGLPSWRGPCSTIRQSA